MTVLECGDDIIIVDVGLGFPAAEMLGVDLLLPDITYLRDKRDRIRAIFITHGHEDHIGGLAYLLADRGNPPIYATRLTLGLGYLSPPPGTLIGQGEAAALPDRQVVYAVTGSQGEPMAALSRIASGEHRTIFPQPGDTVIVSASPIPGNETAISRIVDDLFRQGVHVIYSAIERVHVSGHAAQEELKLMLNLTRPRYVVPFHGESRHLALYGRLAETVGVPRERILSARLGTVLELSADDARHAGKVPAGHQYVAGSRIGTLSDLVFQERQALSRDGVVFVTVTIDAQAGDLLAGPEIASRGFLPADLVAEAFALTRDRVRDAVVALGVAEHGVGRVNLNQRIKEEARAVIWEQVRRRPLVLPLVVEA